MPMFVQTAISIASLVKFRDMINKALKDTLEADASHIVGTVFLVQEKCLQTDVGDFFGRDRSADMKVLSPYLIRILVLLNNTNMKYAHYVEWFRNGMGWQISLVKLI
jgi:hypothetical protein